MHDHLYLQLHFTQERHATVTPRPASVTGLEILKYVDMESKSLSSHCLS